jgi:hypothetical protein
MKTLALAAADGVVLLHLLWIVFLIGGAWPGRRRPWVKWTHLAALGFSVALQVFGWVCPLTHVEAWLRAAGGAQPYEGTFIRHYLERLVYVELPPPAILLGTLIVIGVTLWLYFAAPPRR